MSESTKIAWCDSTASPWFGCSEVSPGCLNCYARELTLRYRWAGWGDDSPRVRSKSFWKDVPKWQKEAKRRLDEWQARRDSWIANGQANHGPGKQWLALHDQAKPQPPRIFPSLMDWLDPKVSSAMLAEFLKVIHDCPNLDFLLLTKRPELFEQRLGLARGAGYLQPSSTGNWIPDWLDGKAPHNVWVGATAEDQQRANERIPALLKIPAQIRFLSCEPLLGPIDVPGLKYEGTMAELLKPLDWVIVGGESGKNARPCNIEWIRSIKDQCKAAGVKCFVKQFGACPISDAATPGEWPGTAFRSWERRDARRITLKHPKGGDPDEWPEDLRVREFPNSTN